MTFNLTLNTKKDSIIQAKDIRQSLVESSFTLASQNVHSGIWTREQAVKALCPILDTLTSGVKSKGHAETVRDMVQDNLDAAIDVISSKETEETGEKSKPAKPRAQTAKGSE